jgi:hypothetical protein
MGRQPARDPDPPVATGEGAERQYSINTLSIDRMVHQSGHRPTLILRLAGGASYAASYAASMDQTSLRQALVTGFAAIQ